MEKHTFVVGSFIRRKKDYQTGIWKQFCDQAGINTDSLVTIKSNCNSTITINEVEFDWLTGYFDLVTPLKVKALEEWM